MRDEINSKANQHRKEISDKNDKIQELMDELLEKDTLIDNQAVLNKNLQKKLDHLNDSQAKFNDQYAELQSKLTRIELENNSLKDSLKKDEQSTKDKFQAFQDAEYHKDLIIKQLRDELDTVVQTHKLEIDIAQLTMQQKVDDLIAEVAVLKDKEGEARRQLENERKLKVEMVKQVETFKDAPKPIYQTTQKKPLKSGSKKQDEGPPG